MKTKFRAARACAVELISHRTESGAEGKMIVLVPIAVEINGLMAQSVFSIEGRKWLESKGFFRMSYFDTWGCYAAPFHPLTLEIAEQYHKAGFLYDEETEKIKSRESSFKWDMIESQMKQKLKKGENLNDQEEKLRKRKIAKLAAKIQQLERKQKLAIKSKTCATFNQH